MTLDPSAVPSSQEPFQPHVEFGTINTAPQSPLKSGTKKGSLKTFQELQALFQSGKPKEVKLMVRENDWPVADPVRTQLWVHLCRLHAADKNTREMEGFYWDTVKQIFGTTDLPEDSISLPAFVDPSHLHCFHLSHAGRTIAERITSVIGYSYPDITYGPGIFPLTCLLLHYMPEFECFSCLSILLGSKTKKFITQTKLHFESSWRTAMHLAKKHVKSAFTYMSRFLDSSDQEELFYQSWYWWMFQQLPFPHLIRMMDCYLVEGRKVLYRVSMAILRLFMKYSSQLNTGWNKDLATLGVHCVLAKFCNEIPVSPEKLLKTAFTIRAFRTIDIERVSLKTEMYLKSKSVLGGSTQLARPRSQEDLPTSQCQVNIQMMSNTLTVREGDSSPSPRSKSMGFFPIENIKSNVTHKNNLLTLWSWLPLRITMYQPLLLYTNEEHGCSLTTFYTRVEQYEPTLLLIKTLSDEVFGAYCSTRWSERNLRDEHGNRQTYFGTGETFLFTLQPQRQKYQWVGIRQSGDQEKQAGVEHSAELFMAGNIHMVTIGGGKGQGIWLDENLRHGETETCETFNNPPLCPSKDFVVSVLEVYGFAGT